MVKQLQCLKEMFKPAHPIPMSKEEAEIAAYIFCKELTDEDVRLVLVVFVYYVYEINHLNP